MVLTRTWKNHLGLIQGTSNNFLNLCQRLRGHGRLTRRGHIGGTFRRMALHGGTCSEALLTFWAKIVGDTKVGFYMILEAKVRKRATGAQRLTH